MNGFRIFGSGTNLRLNDDDRYNPQYGLISRSVLSSPIVKMLGVEMDIEYKINLGFL